MQIEKTDLPVNPEYSHAWNYVQAITGLSAESAVMDFRAIHDCNKALPAQKLYGSLPSLWHQLCSYNELGYGIFANINEMDGKGHTLANVNAIRCHAVDLDSLSSQQNYEAACRFTPAASFAVDTSVVDGRVKRHVYWTVERYAGVEYATNINRRLRQKFGGDKAVVDPSRVLRVAGFVHRKRPDAPHLITMHPLAGMGCRYPVQALDIALADVTCLDGGIGTRHPLGDPSLAAPSLAYVERALAMIDPNDLNRSEWLSTLAAAKQAAWTHATPSHVDAMLMDWSARYDTDDPAEDAKQIASLRDTSVGWTALLRRAPALHAEMMFGATPPQAGTAIATEAATTPELAFWSTFNATDGAKTAAVACMKCLSDVRMPVAYDEFADALVITAKVPWHESNLPYPRRWTDNDTHGCKAFLEMMMVRPSKETVFDSVSFIAHKNQYHPVREYLLGVQWDGFDRLATFLPTYFGAPDTSFVRTVGAKYLISAVARIMDPGCKVDTMLILEGEQGLRKSTALRALAGDDWFTDQMPDLANKDASIQVRGKWLIEFAELDRMNRAEVTAVKSYASRQIDTYRPPYGRSTVDVPRQCVFAGSTNETEYLRDQTGNRRYWPVACGRIDVEALQHDRDQLWAQAAYLYNAKACWWLEGDEQALAVAEQDERRERDPWEAIIQPRLGQLSQPITVQQVCVSILGVPFEKQNAALNKRVALCLRRAGYQRQQIRTGADRQWAYMKGG